MACCGNTTTTTGAGAAPPDTGKRVNYTKGMLLGVDDFVQEQAWHIARRHELAREVLGYGTVRGLKVGIDPGTAKVRVSPGMAWMPSGTPVCVGSAQCADIDAWLGRHWDAVSRNLPEGTEVFDAALFVVLAYDSALTDLMPVPGEPCRDDSQLTEHSRVADCFRLELRLQPPVQTEEDAVRDFADWLAQVPQAEGPAMAEDAFLEALRDAAGVWLEGGTPDPLDYMLGTPPAGLASDDALLRAALRLWVTELRPLWRARHGCGPLPVAPGGRDDAVLLARLDLRVHVDGRRADPEPDIGVVEDARPVLLSLRLLQELITQNPAPEPASEVEGPGDFGDDQDVGTSTAYARADHFHGLPELPELVGDVTGAIVENALTRLRTHGFSEDAPELGEVLVVGTGNVWTPATLPLAARSAEEPPKEETRWGLSPDVGSSEARYARADHTHGTPTPKGDVEAVELETGEPPDQELRVRRLQRVPLSHQAPKEGQVLTYGKLELEEDLAIEPGEGLEPGFGWRPQSLPSVAVPGPAVDPPSRVARGSSSERGGSLLYARADHKHGLDALPAAGGDASGTLEFLTVTRIQGKAVSNVGPLGGQVLTFNESSAQWEPKAPTGGGTTPAPVGRFVEREAGPYKLVTAGTVFIEPAAAPADRLELQLPSYTAKKVELLPSPSSLELRLAITANVKGAAAGKPSYIVKLTPVWLDDVDDGAIEFSPYLLGLVQAEGDEIFFRVRLRLSDKPKDGDRFGLQFEVSQYRD